MINGRPLAVPFGGGVNSAAVLVEMKKRGIKPDVIVMSDTGRAGLRDSEKPETYEFVDTMNRWLVTNAMPEITDLHRRGKHASLEAECLEKGVLPSIAYGFKKCSLKWKVEGQDYFFNRWQPAIDAWANGEKIVKAIGYDAGEERRAKIIDDTKVEFWYPLIEWGMDREACVTTILDAGLPVPIKSACFFCPSSKKAEVIWLSEHHPDLFKRAVEMERAAKNNLVTIKGLGRHWAWEELVANYQTGGPLFYSAPETVEIGCMCFDGEE